MKNAMLVLFGFGLILLLPGKTAIIAVGGLDAGLLSVLAEAKWPKARETYVDPTRRPKPSTPAASYVAAALIALGSAAFATFAWKMALPRFPLVAAFGFYMAAAGVGMSVGIVLTARRSSEAHNAWLASMTPRAPLDF